MTIFAVWREADQRFAFNLTGSAGDAIPQEEHALLLEGEALGMRLVPSESGKPILVERLSEQGLSIYIREMTSGNFTTREQTDEALVKIARAEQALLLSIATTAIFSLQDVVDLEKASIEENMLLRSWKQYRVDLNRIDRQITYPRKIEWPVVPC